MSNSQEPANLRRLDLELRELNAAVAAIRIEGDRVSRGSLDMTGVEAPPKR